MRTYLQFIIALVFTFSLFISTQLQANTKFDEIVFVIENEDRKNPKSRAAAKLHNDKLKAVVKNYWELDLEYKFMKYKEAYKYVGKNKNALVAEIETKLSDTGSDTNMNFRSGKMLKLVLQVRLPATLLLESDMAFAIMHSQFMYKNIGKYKKPSKELPKEFGHLLKNKTLLIAESCLSKKFSRSDLEKIYPHKFEIISDDDLKKAILDKDQENLVLYEANNSGTVSQTTYSYWCIYEPNTGVVVSRHSGSDNGLNQSDIVLIIKRTSKK